MTACEAEIGTSVHAMIGSKSNQEKYLGRGGGRWLPDDGHHAATSQCKQVP